MEKMVPAHSAHPDLQTARVPGEVHREFTNHLCHREPHGAINHALNLPVSLSSGKLPREQPLALPLTHLMKISSNWSTLITPRTQCAIITAAAAGWL